MICDRAEKMERARQKRQRKQARKPAAPSPEGTLPEEAPAEGTLAQAKQLTGNAASAVGAAVRSAVEALTGKS
jgi:hypothetical protein